jgi:hypothetical protein
MNVVLTTWFLNKACQVCGQGACLLFLVCNSCGQISLICQEEGASFLNPLDLTVYAVFEEGACPHCLAIDSLRPAESSEIQAAGFKIGEYI